MPSMKQVADERAVSNAGSGPHTSGRSPLAPPATTSLPLRVELVRSERQGADGRYVGELLHAPVEQLGVDELQVDVGQAGQDRVRPALAGYDREHHHLQSIHQAGGEQRL